MTPPMTTACSGRAEGGFRSEGAPGRAVYGPPLIPPPPPRGGPAALTERARRGGVRRRQEGGPGREPRTAPQRGSREAAARPPPPNPPTGPQPVGAPAPTPPRQGGWSPLPPPERGAGARPAPPPQPPAPTGTAGNKRARANAPGRRTDRAQRRRASTNRSGMGATPPMTTTTPVTPDLLPAQGRQMDGTRQSDPPPYWPPWPHKQGARRTGRPPPPTRPPAHERHGPAPQGSHSPKPGRGEPGPDRPPPKHARESKGPGQDTWRGTDHVERLYQRPVPGPREVRTPHHPGGGGADAAGARAHTHAKGTRGLPEGQPDRARGTHRPRGMTYQQARVRDTRTGRPATRSAGHAGREGANGRDTTPGTGPSPPNRPRAPRTHGRGTAPGKAVAAHCATPRQPPRQPKGVPLATSQ